MGLDASVYCDCFPLGRIRRPPPYPELAYFDETMGVGTRATELPRQLEFDRWRLSEMCEHEDGVLCHRYLGNIATIGRIRSVLNAHRDRLPLLTSRVVIDGAHSGDHLTVVQVKALSDELEFARTVVVDPSARRLFTEFIESMTDVVEAAQRVRHPVCF